MSEFRSQYNHPDVARYHKSFSGVVPVMAWKKFDDGHYDYVEVGQTDVDAKIQESRDSVDLKKIVERYLRTGDRSVLERRLGVYGDFPTLEYKDVLNAKNELLRVWSGMSSHDREVYGNDFEAFANNELVAQQAVNTDNVQEVNVNESQQDG